MSNYDNTLSGALFVNNDKRTDKHPDYKGSITTEDGVEYWCSAWIKVAKSGKTAGKEFLSLALTPKDDNAQQGREVNRMATTGTNASDFLNRNRENINKTQQQMKQERQQRDDLDLDDSDIPFSKAAA